jgi:hypothetical protein
MEKHEVAKLIGAPPGYVGYEEGGQLTEAVRAKPYSIVLLDEVEKAHPDVFNLLLQILEDGRLTDNKGNTISFKNTIIIATSNLGSQIIQKFLLEKAKNASKTQPNTPVAAVAGDTATVPVEQKKDSTGSYENQEVKLKLSGNTKEEGKEDKDFSELTKLLQEELHKFFRPELLNRFDDLVVFKPLSEGDMSQIGKLAIEKTQKLLKEQGFDITITDQALAVLAKEGYDPVYGARPLRRLVQSSIENPIALALISKQYTAGDTIQIDYDTTKQQYTLTKITPPPQPAVGQVGAQQPQVQPGTTTPDSGLPPAPQPNGATLPSAAPQTPMSAPLQQPVQTTLPQQEYYGATPSQPIQPQIVPPPAPNSSNGATMQMNGSAAA